MKDPIYDGSFLVEQDGQLRRKRPNDDLLCDFCCQPLGKSCWTYPCGDMELPLIMDPTGLPARSDDPWACCNKCQPLVQAKNWQALAELSLKMQLEVAGMDSAEIIHAVGAAAVRQIVKHFQRFDAARTGEPYQETAPYSEH